MTPPRSLTENRYRKLAKMYTGRPLEPGRYRRQSEAYEVHD